MNQAPTLRKMRKDKEVITPTLILPPLKGEEIWGREKMGTIHRAPTRKDNS